MVSFDHAALVVSDLEAALAFYEDAFDMDRGNEFVGADGAENAFVLDPDGRGLQFKEPPEGVGRSGLDGAAGGVDHLGFHVDDLDARLAYLNEEWDIPTDRGPIETPGGSARVAFVEDPEGYVVELVEENE